MSPSSYCRALSSLTRLLALLKKTSEVPKRQVVKTAGVWYGLGGCGWKDVGMVATR